MLWNEEMGIWLDFDISNNKSRPYFVTTNLAPLAFGCYDSENKAEIARKVLAYVKSTGMDSFEGGVPTTLRNTGQQWDYPNAWPPLQHLLTEGLRTLGNEDTNKLADDLTRKWILNNYKTYEDTGVMYEKVC